MSLNSKLKSLISSKLYYSQPVYIPGYKYSPWKKWITVSVILLLLTILVVLFVALRSNTANTNINTEQNTTQIQHPADNTTDNKTSVGPTATLQTKSVTESNCDSNYSPCVPVSTADLDCTDIGFTVRVLGSDPHGFDRDGDGYGCESY